MDLRFTIDHILPKSRGGRDEFSNYQASCLICNWEKNNSLPGEDWLARKRRCLETKEITEILINTNIHFNTLLQTNSSDPDEIDKLVKSCSAVLVSPHQKELVQKRAYPGTKVIEFVFSPDKTSINNLKVATLELTRGAG